MKITPMPDGGNHFQPENEHEYNLLQDWVRRGFLTPNPPAQQMQQMQDLQDEIPQGEPEGPLEMDLFQVLYPKDPAGAREYFSTINRSHGKEENQQETRATNHTDGRSELEN